MKTSLLSQLQTFIVVARSGSFGSAARELRVTPSAVSQAVKQLEAALGVTLLARTTRSVALTDAGRRLLERAAPGLDEAKAAMTEVSAQPGETVGRLRLSVPRAALDRVIVPVLPTFRARHPRVDVEDRLSNTSASGCGSARGSSMRGSSSAGAGRGGCR